MKHCRIQFIFRIPEAVRLIKSKLLKKNSNVQCLAILLVGNAVRNCTATLHRLIATEDFMGILTKLIKVPGLSPTVLLLIK